MCGTLGQEGGSVNYNYISQNPQIFRGTHVIVYPSFLHLVKMRVQGNKGSPAPSMVSIQQEQQCSLLHKITSPPLSFSLSLSLSLLCRSNKEADGDNQISGGPPPDSRGVCDWIPYRDCGPHKSVHQRGIYIAK